MKMRTIDKAAEYIRERDADTALTKTAIRRLVTTGAVPSVRVGNKYLISLEALNEYLSAGNAAERPAQSETIRPVEIGRGGMVRCPFHDDQNPSAKLYQDRLHCFTCARSRDAVNLIGDLYALKPVEAARKLSDDFNLNLFPGTPLSPRERKQAQEAADERKRDRQIVNDFKQWRLDALSALATFLRECEQFSSSFQGNDYLYADHIFDELLNARTLDVQIAVYRAAGKTIAGLMVQSGGERGESNIAG